MIPLPWMMLGTVALCGAAFVGGCQHGQDKIRAQMKEAEHEAVVAAIGASNELAAADLDAAVAAERARRLAAEGRHKQSAALAYALAKAPAPACPAAGPGIIVQPVEVCRIGADALRVLNAAIGGPAGDRAPAPGGGDGAVPSPEPTDRRQPGSPGPQTPGDGAIVLGVREP